MKHLKYKTILFIAYCFVSITFCQENKEDKLNEKVTKEADTEKTKGGTINDLFTNENTEYFSEEYIALRNTINIDPKEADKKWKSIEEKLQRELLEIQEKGNKLIPEISYQKIANNGGKIPEDVAKAVHKTGVLIVRNTIPQDETSDLFNKVIQYLGDNGAYPPKNPNQVSQVTI